MLRILFALAGPSDGIFSPALPQESRQSTPHRSNCLYPNNSFLVTRDELSLAGYPLLCQHNVIGLQDHLEPGWACAEKKTPEDLIPNICDILTIDCEMVTTTTEENALARLSAVNWSGHVTIHCRLVSRSYEKALKIDFEMWFYVGAVWSLSVSISNMNILIEFET